MSHKVEPTQKSWMKSERNKYHGQVSYLKCFLIKARKLRMTSYSGGLKLAFLNLETFFSDKTGKWRWQGKYKWNRKPWDASPPHLLLFHFLFLVVSWCFFLLLPKPSCHKKIQIKTQSSPVFPTHLTPTVITPPQGSSYQKTIWHWRTSGSGH